MERCLRRNIVCVLAAAAVWAAAGAGQAQPPRAAETERQGETAVITADSQDVLTDKDLPDQTDSLMVAERDVVMPGVWQKKYTYDDRSLLVDTAEAKMAYFRRQWGDLQKGPGIDRFRQDMDDIRRDMDILEDDMRQVVEVSEPEWDLVHKNLIQDFNAMERRIMEVKEGYAVSIQNPPETEKMVDPYTP